MMRLARTSATWLCLALAVQPARADVATFSTRNVRAHIWQLSRVVGSRREGGAGERAAAAYIEEQFRAAGYMPVRQTFPLPGGRTSQNVIATLRGSLGAHAEDALFIGAHYDSRTDACPGADDNASGVGVLLETARVLRGEGLPFSVRFVAFGAEEMIDRNRDHHHYGSRFMARQYRASGKAALILGMISVDMIGVGPDLYVRSMGKGDSILVHVAQQSAAAVGMHATYKADPRGGSDHEPFEKIGVPVAWIERLPDPWYHSPQDVCGHIKDAYLAGAGKMVLRMVLTLDAAKLRAKALAAQTWR